MKKFNEKYLRSLAKVVTMRIIFTFVHITNTFIVTGSLKYGLTIMSLATLVNMVIYFCHERIWNLFKWGRESLHVNNKNVV